jgi:hypothetical protein
MLTLPGRGVEHKAQAMTLSMGSRLRGSDVFHVIISALAD